MSDRVFIVKCNPDTAWYFEDEALDELRRMGATVTTAERDGIHHSYGLTTKSYPVYREVRP